MPARPAPPRQSDLAMIHIAKKDLDMPEDQYRGLLWSLCRVKSSRDLDHAGRARMLEHFKACGWKPKPSRSRRLSGVEGSGAAGWDFVFKLPAARQPLGKKLFRLAQAIGALQQPPRDVMPKGWVEGGLRQMRGIARDADTDCPLEMATDAELHALVAALETHRRRLDPPASKR